MDSTIDVRALLDAVQKLQPQPVPLTKWAAEIGEIYQSRARSTRCRMRQALRETVALAGEGATTLDLTAGLVGRFGASRPDRRKATTDGLLRALRAAFHLAVRKRWAEGPQMAGVCWSVRKSEPRRTRHHPARDVAKVLDHLGRRKGTWKGHRLYVFASVLAYAGVRKTEALRLRWEDVDLTDGFLQVLPNGAPLKTDQSKDAVPIPDTLVPILRAWKRRCGSGWVVPKLDGSGPWINGTAGKRPGDQLRAAGEACGVSGFTPHSLRHSLASVLSCREGLTDRQVRQILRHSPGSFAVEGYIHPEQRILRGLVAGFDFSGSAMRA